MAMAMAMAMAMIYAFLTGGGGFQGGGRGLWLAVACRLTGMGAAGLPDAGGEATAGGLGLG